MLSLDFGRAFVTWSGQHGTACFSSRTNRFNRFFFSSYSKTYLKKNSNLWNFVVFFWWWRFLCKPRKPFGRKPTLTELWHRFLDKLVGVAQAKTVTAEAVEEVDVEGLEAEVERLLAEKKDCCGRSKQNEGLPRRRCQETCAALTRVRPMLCLGRTGCLASH